MFTLTLTEYMPHTVNATSTIITTSTVYSTSSDGYIWSAQSSYSAAWGAISGTVDDSSAVIVGGEQSNLGTPLYLIYRSFLFFDTSSIPLYANITSATLRLYVSSIAGSNYEIQLQTGGINYPHDSLQATDYYQARYSGNGGSSNISTASAGAYWNISLTSTGLSWINPGAQTAFALRNSDDINAEAGSADSRVQFYSRNYGLSFAPELVITYTVSDVLTNYLVHGPYYEDGTVANDIVSCTLAQPYDASLTNTFNGTDGVADTWNITLSQPASYLKWNITSSYNYTRFYYFTNSSFDEVWLYIPRSSDLLQQYSINTILLGQLTNAYTSTLENIGGTNRVIERQSADAINSLPFFLCMYNQYSLRISSDEGTWTFNLPADTVQTKTFTITADMITQAESLRTFTVNATRNNATSLTFYYNDPSEETISVTTLIQHYTLGSLVTDYTQTDLSNTQTFTLNNLTSGTNYIANVTATRNNDVQTWQIEIPSPDAGLVWTSAFDSLGDFPIPAYQLPALAICILFFGIGNWRDSEAVCLLVIIVCGVLQVIGWGSFPLPGLIMAGMIVVFAYLHKGKVESVMIES